jgi:4a-hydroxytetrahydrobiopterin dehydratase
MMTELVDMQCIPCRGDAPQVTEEEMKEYLPQVPEWQVITVDGERRLKRAYKFKNFAAPLAFTNKIGELAEEQDHHPLITLEWGKVTVSWWTHAIGGLHRNDFVMAAKCDEIFESSR